MNPYDAVMNGDLDALRQMDPDSLSARDDNRETPAHDAANEGHLEVVQYLHEVVPHTLWAENDEGKTPADFAKWNIDCRAPAGRAARYARQAVTDYLSKPWTPLMHAAADRRAADVERLLHQGADPTVSVTHKGRTDTALTLATTEQGEHADSSSSSSSDSGSGSDSDSSDSAAPRKREVCQATVELIMGALEPWSPESHHLFPPAFRRGVRHVLGLMMALNAQRQAVGKAQVRVELWHQIIAHLPREWGSDCPNPLNYVPRT